MEWHSMNAEQISKQLKVRRETGLNTDDAKKRFLKFGANALIQSKPPSFFKKLIAQFSDFMVITLIIAAVISFITSIFSQNSDYIDSIIIISIVVINAAIGILQESKAEKEIESLKKISSPLVKVRRNKKIVRISSAEVVPGEILILSAGDLVAADARVIKSSNLAAEESALTGETFSVEKSSDTLTKSKLSHDEKKNMVFAGSIITRGHAEAIAIATGANTEIGKISSMINLETSEKTPMQKNLASTGKILGICIILISAAVFILGILHHADMFEMFLIAISLAVAAIPEGLPAVITVVLASGVRIMAKHGTIVRKLPAIEALGHATVICTDKTGTLTMNKMTAAEICSASKNEYIHGKSHLNEFCKNFFSIAALCNNSVATKTNNEIIFEGEPTENALLSSALRADIDIKNLNLKFPRRFEIPFDSTRKLMTTVHDFDESSYLVITKGAPDILLKICSKYEDETGGSKILDKKIQVRIQSQISAMTDKALRIVAIAHKKVPKEVFGLSCAEKNLTFTAMVGIIDPPRPETKSAVEECKKAGIRTIMITGDHAGTAKAVAKTVGINHAEIVIGSELDKLTEKELREKVKSCSIFARVSPKHKVKIVKALQKNGEIVAMTGDGVNDAPALKAADIGCAMGKSGTDAAKFASDLILTDDNFSVIVEAVRQGRGIYDNIKKTIHFLLSTNISEVMVVFLAFLIGVPSPLLAIHLLWINLVTDAFPALALGVDPIDKNIMKRQPESSRENIFAGSMGYNIIVEGTLIATMGLLSYSIGKVFYDINPLDPIIGRTMAFLTLGISQTIHTFNVRSKKPLLKTGMFTNKKLVFSVGLCIALQIIVVTIPSLVTFFKTASLDFVQWMSVISLSLIPTAIFEIEKRWNKKQNKNP